MYFEASSSTDLQFNPNSDTLSVAIGQLFNLSGPRFPLMTKKKKDLIVATTCIVLTLSQVLF